MNAPKLFIPLIFWLHLFLIGVTPCLATVDTVEEEISVENSDIFYLLGYQDFISGHFAEAADHFFLATKSEDNEVKLNKARLFLALSQAKLRNKVNSAFNAATVKSDLLDVRERELFKRLKYYLGIYFETAYNNKIAAEELAEKTFVWFLPYAGSSTYSAESQKETAFFYGMTGLIARQSWAMSLGGEKFNLKFKNGLQDYTQTQGAFSFTGVLENATTISARFTNISSNLSTQDGIKVYGLGSSFWPSSSLKMNVDFFYAAHPQSELGAMSVSQASTHLDYWIFSNAEYEWWLRLGDQVGKPNARDIQKGTSFIKNKFYNRVFGEVNFRVDHFILGASYWLGNEYFGIRNEGNLIFSATEEHIGGMSAYAAYMMNKNDKFQVNMMKENLSVDGIVSNSTTLVGMLTYRFN